jgi:hypothetical protein
MTPTLKVDSRLFWLVAQFRSLDPDLESIHCVAVQPHPEKGVYIVALNGFHAGIAHDENGEASESFVLRYCKDAANPGLAARLVWEPEPVMEQCNLLEVA